MLVTYVRDRKNNLVGAVVSIVDGDVYRVGWSLCRKGDRFSKDKAKMIAIGRAKLGSQVSIPHSVRGKYEYMQDRASKYYKNSRSAEQVRNFYKNLPMGQVIKFCD